MVPRLITGRNLLNCKKVYVAHSLSLSASHCSEMAEEVKSKDIHPFITLYYVITICFYGKRYKSHHIHMHLVMSLAHRILYMFISSSGEVESWQEVKQYLNVNQHLDQSTPSTSAPQSGLEARVNEAIEKGDLHTAEALSDSLAARDVSLSIWTAYQNRHCGTNCVDPNQNVPGMTPDSKNSKT